MGNKQTSSAATVMARTHSTVAAPTQHQQQQKGAQRLNRRRSDFQQSKKNSDNTTTTTATSSSTLSSADRPPSNNAPQQNGGGPEERARQNRRRWSSVAIVNPRGGGVVKPKRLTPRQCHLVIKSWSKRSPKSRVIKDIFAAIFTEAEELKATFGIETSSTGKRLRADPNFVQHTNMFADTLDFVVRNLDDLSLVTENAEQLGRRHASFPLENGFRPEYWSIFTECIVDGVCAQEEDKESQIAWRVLVQTIVYYMKLGYDRETLRIARHASFRRSNSPLPAHRRSPIVEEQQQQRPHPQMLGPPSEQQQMAALEMAVHRRTPENR